MFLYVDLILGLLSRMAFRATLEVASARFVASSGADDNTVKSSNCSESVKHSHFNTIMDLHIVFLACRK